MKIIQYLSINNDCYKNNVNKADSRYTTFQSRGPLGLMLHSVGCAQPSAKVFADRWNQSGYEVAVHAVLQEDGTVYQCLPWNYRGWHCGGDANNTHVGVEMTEPAGIKYTSGASFTVTDRAAAVAHAKGCYETAVELFAQLCNTYSLDPMTAIISHKEGAAKGVASGHVDPEHLWSGLGLGYTMDTFRAAVKAKMAPEKNDTSSPGWVEDDRGWWYRYADGSWPAAEWRQIDGVWYYFRADGYMARDETISYDGKLYTFDHNGHVTVEELLTGTRYYRLGDITSEYYRPTIDKLISGGILKGKGGSGEGLIVDLSEDAVRLLVILDRAGVFDR